MFKYVLYPGAHNFSGVREIICSWFYHISSYKHLEGLADHKSYKYHSLEKIWSDRGHMSERIFRSNRPGYPHPVSSELENSGIRVAVGDCSVTERRRWRLPYQTGKTVHVHANTLQTWRGRTHGAGCVRQWFRTAEPLGEHRYENWNTHTHKFDH